MKTLTATNKRVQTYLTFTTDKPTTSLKQKRLDQLEESLLQRNIMLDELFPNKQLGVIDHLLYITAASGISKVGAERIAEKCNCSVRTVYSAIKGLKTTNEFIVGRLIKTKGGAGKYIIVDKKHPNFKEIMKEVFFLSDAKITELNAEQFAEQKNLEGVGAVSVKGQKKSSNIDNSFKDFKQAINNNDLYIENEIKKAVQEEIEKNATNNREYVVEYASNTYQIAFYDFLDSMPMPKSIEAVKSVLALRVGSNATRKTFTRAVNLIKEMSLRIYDGYQYENVVAAFTGGLKKAVTYNVPQVVKADPKPSDSRKVTFYNWLEERD